MAALNYLKLADNEVPCKLNTSLSFHLASNFNELFLISQSQIFKALLELRVTLKRPDIHGRLITHAHTIWEDFLT